MRRLCTAFLGVCLLLASTACTSPGQELPIETVPSTAASAATVALPTTIPTTTEPPLTTIPTTTTPPTEATPTTMATPPLVAIDPDRPIEDEPTVQFAQPGLPVFREVKLAAVPTAAADPDGPPQEEKATGYYVFERYDDPPPEGTVRLVYADALNTDAQLIENKQEVEKILSIVDAFAASDYDKGEIMGGLAVSIQVVRAGKHQNYTVTASPHAGGYLARNGREHDAWYTVSKEDFAFLTGYFKKFFS